MNRTVTCEDTITTDTPGQIATVDPSTEAVAVNSADPEPDGPDVGAVESTSASTWGRNVQWGRLLTYGVLPTLALLLALGAGYAKWLAATMHFDPIASAESVEAATNGTIAMLSYQHDTVEGDLVAAAERLTGEFKDAYTTLVNDVVIPGSKEQRISAMVSVPAAAPVEVSSDRAVVMVFVNQTTTIGDDPPTDLTSTVRVTLDKVDGQWLISQFEPI